MKRFRLFFEHLYVDPNPRVLHVQFEELALDYGQTVSRILKFLGMPESNHMRPRTRFRPEASAQNVGLWKHYNNTKEIQYLKSELSLFLVQ